MKFSILSLAAVIASVSAFGVRLPVSRDEEILRVVGLWANL